MWVVFLWSEMCTYAAVGDVSASIKRDVVFRDENDGVCALDCTGNALCQSAQFLTIHFPPDGAVFGVLMRYLYSVSSPVSLLRIVLRKSVGNSLDAACLAVKVGDWSWERCSRDSWVMDCIRLRVLYAGEVGITLGDAASFICGGTVTTLGEGAAGSRGGWSDCGGMELSCWGLVSLWESDTIGCGV